MDTSADGLSTWRTLWNNGSPITESTVTTYPDAHTRVVTKTAPDNTQMVSTYSYGRLVSVTSPTAQTAYDYDDQGRLWHATDLVNNTTTTYAYTNSDQLIAVTTPLGTTQTTYDNLGRPTQITQPDLSQIINQYNPRGQLTLTHGALTYPAGYGYDSQGRMTKMTNWAQYGSAGGERVTTWAYHPQRGWLSSKTYADNHGSTYTYTAGGRLKTRLWERGLSTTYHYGFEADSHSGYLTQVSYSDATPSVSITYDRLARPKVVTHSGITTTLIHTNYANQILSETYAGGILDGYTVTHSYDNLLRPSGADAWKTTLLAHQALGYSPQNGLINSASDGTNSASYSYIANSALIRQITFQHGGQTVMTTTNEYDALNRLTNIVSARPTNTVVSAGYYYNAANQRTNVVLADRSYWAYQYDTLGQMQSGKRYWSEGTAVPGQQFEYIHDDIGNRTGPNGTKAGGDQNGTGLRSSSYTPNALNQYSSRTVPSQVDVTGMANASSNVTLTVSIDGENATPYRHNEYFQAVGTVNNTNGPAWTPVTVTASRGGTNSTQSGNLSVPPANQIFQYDADGNLTNDLVWNYTWDGENRLIAMECQVAGPTAQHLTFEYDWQGRRIHKVVKDASQNTLSDTRFLYEGWNLVAELNAQGGVVRSCLWGLDLSGTPQGAGGVGGLLQVTDATLGSHFACYDGNGNVMALIKAADGSTTAQYEYGPFGEQVRVSGSMGKSNPFRWSTKYTDGETDLIYYGYRYYSTGLGRWLSRDPIEESGSRNLYVFACNDPVARTDYVGLADGPTRWYNPLSWYNDGPTWMDASGSLYYGTQPSEMPPPNQPITYADYRDLLLEDDGMARFFGLKQTIRDSAVFLLELTPQNTVSVVFLGEDFGGARFGIAGRAKCAALSGPGIAYVGAKVWRVSGALLKRLKGKSADQIETFLAKECCGAAKANPNAQKGPYLPHIKGEVGEMFGWQKAIKEKGHIPIQGLGAVTAPGPDYITFDTKSKIIVVWDAKYRNPAGKIPKTIPSLQLQSWLLEVRRAIEAMPAGPGKNAATEALISGRVRGEVFVYP